MYYGTTVMVVIWNTMKVVLILNIVNNEKTKQFRLNSTITIVNIFSTCMLIHQIKYYGK